MSTRRYRWAGVSSADLDNFVEPGSGASLDFLQRTPWTEITVVDGTRDQDLDDYMAKYGYVVDATGPTLVVSSSPHPVGTEQVVLVDASAGPVIVLLPLTSTRLGNDIQVQKIDNTANAVTVSRTGADTIDGVVSRTLALNGDSLWLVADPANSEWHVSQSRIAQDITFDSSGLPQLSADNVQDAISDILNNDLGSIEILNSGEALTLGDVVTLDSTGDVVRADSSIGGALYEVIGIAAQTVGAGVPVPVVTHSGSIPNVRFTSAPAGALNGRLVFLSTTAGLASVTPPGSGGNAIFTIGTLQGADGVSTTPTVVFRPQLIALRS
jgi:hypothetical protein